MDKKYQIFVSSTYSDLKGARDKVIEAILKMYHMPVGMEMFSADNAEQWDVIKDTIDDCDYYIVIIGHRYGSLTKDSISYTEKEYDYAKEKGIPIMAFIRERKIATTEEERDTDPALSKKLEEFIKKAQANKVCDFWNTEDNLATTVSIALTKIFHKAPGVGWVKANKALSAAVSDELAKLSAENRDLRRAIENYEKKKNLPLLDFQLNDKSYLELEYENIFIRMQYCSTVDWSLILKHGREFGEEIYSANWQLPSDSEVDEFNAEYELYWRKRNTGIVPSITLGNGGVSTAHSPFYIIKFPKEVALVDLVKLKTLQPPIFPIQCLDGAFKHQRDLLIKYLYPFYITNEKKESRESTKSKESQANGQIYEYNNQYTYEADKLVQKMCITLNREFKLVPLKSIQTEFSIEIMCEEYEKFDEQKFKLEIKEIN